MLLEWKRSAAISWAVLVRTRSFIHSIIVMSYNGLLMEGGIEIILNERAGCGGENCKIYMLENIVTVVGETLARPPFPSWNCLIKQANMARARGKLCMSERVIRQNIKFNKTNIWKNILFIFVKTWKCSLHSPSHDTFGVWRGMKNPK